MAACAGLEPGRVSRRRQDMNQIKRAYRIRTLSCVSTRFIQVLNTALDLKRFSLHRRAQPSDRGHHTLILPVSPGTKVAATFVG